MSQVEISPILGARVVVACAAITDIFHFNRHLKHERQVQNGFDNGLCCVVREGSFVVMSTEVGK